MSEDRVDIYAIIGMWLRKVPVRHTLKVHRRLREAGLRVSLRDVETQHLAGGDTSLCAEALIEAHRRRVTTDWMTIAILDLAGYDPLAIVQSGSPLDRIIGHGGNERFKKPAARNIQ